MEKTFDINLRLKRWESNNKKWNKTSTKSKVLTVFDSHNKSLLKYESQGCSLYPV